MRKSFPIQTLSQEVADQLLKAQKENPMVGKMFILPDNPPRYRLILRVWALAAISGFFGGYITHWIMTGHPF